MIVNPKKRRAHRWLRESSVQFDPELRFHLGGHDYHGSVGETSAYDPLENRILWEGQLRNQQDRGDLYHEAAHGIDMRYMTDADRERARRLMDPTGRYAHVPWNPPDGMDPANTNFQPMRERFADFVAQLAMTKDGYPAMRQFLAQIQARGPHS